MPLKLADYAPENSGWSLAYREDAAGDSPWLVLAQGLWKNEAVTLGRLVYNRDRRGTVELRDHTGTARGYWNARSPRGSHDAAG